MKKLCCIVLVIILLSPIFFIGVSAENEDNPSDTIGSERYEDLNLVSISEYKGIDVDEEKVRYAVLG